MGYNPYYYGHGVPQDYAEAAKSYRKAAEQGHADAQNELGHAYYYGYGVPQDYAEGAKWCWKAAEQEGINGDRYSIAYYCYHNVTQDYAEALKWYRKLAEQGDVQAWEFLADFFPQDYVEAVSNAAEQGHTDAQYELGYAYYNGRRVPEDRVEAAKWFGRAAEQGNADAQYCLGDAYYQGKGIAQDYVQAYMWMDLAASVPAGYVQKKWYASARDAVAAEMTPQQIAEAQGLAGRWKPK